MAQEQSLALWDLVLLLSVQPNGVRTSITDLYWNSWKQISIDLYEYRNDSLLSQWLC